MHYSVLLADVLVIIATSGHFEKESVATKSILPIRGPTKSIYYIYIYIYMHSLGVCGHGHEYEFRGALWGGGGGGHSSALDTVSTPLLSLPVPCQS